MSVEAREGDPDPTLTMYRRSLEIRGRLREGGLEWMETDTSQVLAFRRPNGWVSVANFGNVPYSLPEGELLLSSSPVSNGALPGAATAWLLR
jgi:alpha-glucosidase